MRTKPAVDDQAAGQVALTEAGCDGVRSGGMRCTRAIAEDEHRLFDVDQSRHLKMAHGGIPYASRWQAEGNEQMSRRVLVMLSFMLVGAIWAVCPASNSQTIPLMSAAQAQTAADHPASFTGSLVELPTLERTAIRHTVYVAAYSTVRLGGGKGNVDLATTLSIHNTSEERPLILLRVDYFDTGGNLLHHYLPSPIAIRPFGSVQTFVPAQDTRGGTGANFVVEWATNGQITEPLIEAVMIGTLGAQGFSLTSRGKTMTDPTP